MKHIVNMGKIGRRFVPTSQVWCSDLMSNGGLLLWLILLPIVNMSLYWELLLLRIRINFLWKSLWQFFLKRKKGRGVGKARINIFTLYLPHNSKMGGQPKFMSELNNFTWPCNCLSLFLYWAVHYYYNNFFKFLSHLDA